MKYEERNHFIHFRECKTNLRNFVFYFLCIKLDLINYLTYLNANFININKSGKNVGGLILIINNYSKRKMLSKAFKSQSKTLL